MQTNLSSSPEQLVPLLMIFNIAFGVLECFFGLRYWKIILGILGFLVGVGVGIAALALICQSPLPIALVGGAVTGAAGALLFARLVKFGTFVAAATTFGGFPFFVTQMLISEQRLASNEVITSLLVVAVFMALIGGIATLAGKDRGIVYVSSFAGAWSIVSGLGFFSTAGGLPIAETAPFQLLGIAVVSFLGMLVQNRESGQTRGIFSSFPSGAQLKKRFPLKETVQIIIGLAVIGVLLYLLFGGS
jgi:hypothetical protein